MPCSAAGALGRNSEWWAHISHFIVGAPESSVRNWQSPFRTERFGYPRSTLSECGSRGGRATPFTVLAFRPRARSLPTSIDRTRLASSSQRRYRRAMTHRIAETRTSSRALAAPLAGVECASCTTADPSAPRGIQREVADAVVYQLDGRAARPPGRGALSILENANSGDGLRSGISHQ